MQSKRMIRQLSFIGVIGLGLILGMGCQKKSNVQELASGAESVQTEIITVSAAASMKEALTDVVHQYENSHSQVKVTVNLGGSGVLAQQIEQGAAVDVFLSASNKQMKTLVDKKLITQDKTFDLLGNRLVLVTAEDSDLNIETMADMQQAAVKTIGVGEPKTVPAGQYAIEALQNLELIQKIEPKLVYGKDVKEVLMWVETGNVDLGLVYKTDATASDKVKILAEVPSETHSPIVYPVGFIQSSKHAKAAQAFIDYLSGEEAKRIFEKYGFTTF